MKIIEKNLPLSHKLPRALLSYLPDCRLSVFDIETTGLSHSSDKIILIGLILINEDFLLCKQFLAEHFSEEALILTEFASEVQNVDILFNYNGDRFDIPFINKRCAALGINFQLKSHQSVDLFKIIKNSYFKELLPDLKQKTVETLFCNDRKDTISGGDSAVLYNKYVKSKDINLEQKILLHNFDDVRILYELLRVFGRLDIHQVMFQSGFFVSPHEKSGNNLVKLYIKKIKMESHSLCVTASSINITKYVDDFFENCHIIANPSLSELTLHIATKKEHPYAFIDLLPLDLSDNLSHLPGFHSEYLVLSADSLLNYREINFFIKELICKIQSIYGILNKEN